MWEWVSKHYRTGYLLGTIAAEVVFFCHFWILSGLLRGFWERKKPSGPEGEGGGRRPLEKWLCTALALAMTNMLLVMWLLVVMFNNDEFILSLLCGGVAMAGNVGAISCAMWEVWTGKMNLSFQNLKWVSYALAMFSAGLVTESLILSQSRVVYIYQAPAANQMGSMLTTRMTNDHLQALAARQMAWDLNKELNTTSIQIQFVQANSTLLVSLVEVKVSILTELTENTRHVLKLNGVDDPDKLLKMKEGELSELVKKGVLPEQIGKIFAWRTTRRLSDP